MSDLDTDRQTGQTTRQLQAAVALAKHGDDVVFFVHTAHMFQHVVLLLQGMGVEIHPREGVLFPVKGKPLDTFFDTDLRRQIKRYTTGRLRVEFFRGDKRSLRGRRNTIFIFDHAVPL